MSILLNPFSNLEFVVNDALKMWRIRLSIFSAMLKLQETLYYDEYLTAWNGDNDINKRVVLGKTVVFEIIMHAQLTFISQFSEQEGQKKHSY